MPYVTRKIPQCARCGWEWYPGRKRGQTAAKPKRCSNCKDPNWDKPRMRQRHQYERFCKDPVCAHRLTSHPVGSRGCILPGCECQEAPNLRMTDAELAKYLDKQFPRARVVSCHRCAGIGRTLTRHGLTMWSPVKELDITCPDCFGTGKRLELPK